VLGSAFIGWPLVDAAGSAFIGWPLVDASGSAFIGWPVAHYFSIESYVFDEHGAL
jgi:hypothetical protein